MEIDGFTVVAQLLNFFVLVWLLKKFLYRPVLDAVDARDREITRKLADADIKETAALQERAQFEQKNAEFDRQRAAAWAVVSQEVKTERGLRLEQVRNEYETQRRGMVQKLTEDQQHMAHTLKTEIQREVFFIARKVLADLSSVSLEQQMADCFIGRLTKLDVLERNNLKEALSGDGQAITVKTALEWPISQKAGLETAIATIAGTKVPVQYQVVSSLISGIELTAQDYLLSWNVADYLDVFEKQAGVSMDPKNNPNGKS